MLSACTVGALFVVWLGIVLACGVGYWALGAMSGQGLQSAGAGVGRSMHGLVESVYFSAVTATSVGYASQQLAELAKR